MFSSTAYIRVSRNKFRIRHLETNTDKALYAQTPFSTTRLLIGQFQSAEKALKEGIKQITKGGFFAIAPKVVIHPLEMIEGGLAEVEERVFMEVALGAGARKVIVWIGHELSDVEILERLRTK